MELTIDNIYSGFKLLQIRDLKEINSRGMIFIHLKSGARLCFIENEDDNNVFSISFRTPPRDNTGIPHIIEHSVLCGSRKFPSKEPFVELAKGSLNTFLNAITFPDKTMYPVASKNERDLFNLMDVYLDAVFFPNIYRYQEIFMQEGWHFELDSSSGEINYNGVVYNEMKGVFSTPEEILFRKVPESLFPETPYGFESGGDPDNIPQLSFERFISFHKSYYHPSNSYIFLGGNGDTLEKLKFLNEKYLNNFDSIKVNSGIPLQIPFERQRDISVEYPVSQDDSENEKTYFSLNFVVGRATDPELCLAFNILEYLLLETPASPLKKALLDARIGKDVFGTFEKSIAQPILSIVVKNSEKGKRGDFQPIVFNEVKKLIEKGIDKKLIEASINIHEFRIREADYRGFPKALVYNMQVMDSWLYDGDPFIHLQYEQTLKNIKTSLTTDYFEKLLDKYVINNTHRSLMTLIPKKGLAEEKEKRIREKLKYYRQGLSEKEIEALIHKTDELKKRQAEPDSPENLSAIPLLALKDINPEAEKLPLEERDIEGVKILVHPMFTSRIVYLILLFDTLSVPMEYLPYITLLTSILAKVSTEKYDYRDLTNEINIHTGGIGFGVEAYGDKESDHIYYPKLIVKSKALIHKIPRMFELLGEIIGCTRFDEEKRLREIIQEIKSRLEMTIYEQGHFVTAGRLSSYFSPLGKYVELLTGLTYYKLIAELEKNFATKVDEIIEILKRIVKLIFNKNNLLVSVTTADEDYPSFQQNLPRIFTYLHDEVFKKEEYKFDYSLKNEGLLTPAKVQYVAKGYNFRQIGYNYSGSLEVLRMIVSLDYLWNRVRVQGGAYGSFARFSRNGNVYFCSYRDPNLRETLGVYDSLPGYVRSFNGDMREMIKYIIGTIGRLDHPLTPSMKGEEALSNYIMNISYEDIQLKRDEILRTRKEEIRDCADLIQDVMKQNYICVLGNEEKIKENRDIFSTLTPVFE